MIPTLAAFVAALYVWTGVCIWIACHGPGSWPRPRLILTWLPALLSAWVNNDLPRRDLL